jgi:hypothetical protein
MGSPTMYPTRRPSMTKFLSDPRSRLSVFLWLVALHSTVVGILLVVLPADVMPLFGYAPLGEAFFKSQGGVFHFVMVVAYVLAARDPLKNQVLVEFSAVAKFIGTVFLVTYFLAVDRVWVVLLSGAGDFVMGVVIVVLNGRFRLSHRHQP